MVESSQPNAVERYKQLVTVLLELESILNTDQILKYISGAAAKLCNTREAWLFLSDQTNHRLYLQRDSFANDAQYRELSLPINSSAEGWVISNQQPVMINDASVYDNRIGDLISLPGIVIKSTLIVPMTVNGKQVGVLEVANKRDGDLDFLDQEILFSFAHHVAIYLDNSQRYLQTDLVAELVHELRTPLAALNTALNLLERDDLPEIKHDQIHQVIQTEFYRLTNLTTSFLDYARLESGREKFKPARFDLIQLIRDSVDVMQMHADSKGSIITLDLPAEPLLLIADKDKIKQVILNLLNNALLYSHMGGIVNITTNTSSKDISFSVQDNGPGIPNEDLHLLFERYYRHPNMERGNTGSGLGLTICKKIVEAHKGKIEVSSVMGEGTTFTVYLPINQEI